MHTVFSRQGASPLCLVKIFEHLRSENEVLPTTKTESGRITLPSIENSSSSGSWWGWVKSFVGSSTSTTEIPLNQQLAIMSLVAKHATTLQSAVQTMAMDHSDYLLLESELFAIDALQSFEIEDRYIILAYLESQHKAASIQLNNEVGYKIGRLKSNSIVEVSDSDRDILVVKHTLLQVQQKYEQMQKEITQLKRQAVEARTGTSVKTISYYEIVFVHACFYSFI
jgi:hypothetical protein